ncbi:carbohydrate porin [Acetobacter sacchari]|uniref:Carbohydrate porin n=1 Tax=Acetobacter sacchari TaxID=2661687 RepID=A0ABS3M1I4_9PROT|nr:carbohydrate porin [Acetobacter sacchari]MBO1362001.1 carbohydrate porin [Acetobacter sacchari]
MTSQFPGRGTRPRPCAAFAAVAARRALYNFAWLLFAVSILLWQKTPAHAQVMDRDIGSAPSILVSTPLPANASTKTTVPPFSHPEAIVSNPLSKWLRDRGINFLLDNTNEFAGAITPPTRGATPGFINYRQGASNAGQYAMQLDIDWEKLAGLPGFATHMITVGRYGTTANRMFGDWLNHASEDYGGGGNVVVHLVYLYGEETLYGGRLAIAAGRMSEISDFAASPLFCNFQSGSFCGRPKGITDTNFAAGYPASTWGFRVRGRPIRKVYIQTGVYPIENGIYQVYQHRTGFKLNGANIIGYTAPIETGWEPSFNNGTLPGHYKIGGQVFSTPQNDNFFDLYGAPYAVTRRAPKTHSASWSTWAMFDQRLTHYREKDSGLTALWGIIYNDPHTSLREYVAYGALLNRGFFSSRPYDTMGFSFTYTKIANGVTMTDEYLLDKRRALPNHATGVQHNTIVMEANYAIHVMPGVIFTPLFEYYIHPNGQYNLRDAALLGFKSHIQIM